MDDRILKMIGMTKESSPQELFAAMDKCQMQLMKQVQEARTEEQKNQLRADLKYLEEQKEAVRKTLKSAAQPVTKPVVKPAVQPATKPAPQQVAKPVAKPAPQQAAKPVAKPASQPVVQPAAKPTPQQVAKPAAKPTPQPAPKPVAKPAPKQPAKPTPKSGKSLDDAIWNYNHEFYREAFQEFSQLANNKDAEAAYYLSICYTKGRGTESHSGRAEYWLKESAKGGYTEAQNQYGNRLLKDKDKAKKRKGLRYLKKAAKKGHVQSRKDYIDHVSKKSKGVGDILGGIVLCNAGISKATDPYDKQLLVDDKKLLWGKILGPLKIRARKILVGLVEVLVSLCLIVGAGYFLLGVYAEHLAEIQMDFFPVDERLTLPLQIFSKFLDPFMDAHGKLGLEMLFLSYLYVSITQNDLALNEKRYLKKNATARICQWVTIFSEIALVIGVLHWRSGYDSAPYNPWFMMIVTIVITRFVPFVIGWLINEKLGE